MFQKAIFVLLMALTFQTHAGLLGDTVNFSYFAVEPAEVRASGSVIVGNGVEVTGCDTAGIDACRFFFEVDYRDNSIFTRVSNLSNIESTFAYSLVSTITSLNLGSDIIGWNFLQNTFPVVIACGIGADNLLCFNPRYTLPPNSSFVTEIGFLTAPVTTVPEPGSLGLLVVGLLALGISRRLTT